MRSRRTSAALAGVLLVAAGLVAALGPDAGAETAPAPARPPGERHVVTLVTGDTVTVSDGLPARIAAARGRERTRFSTTTVGGRLRVVPGDALPLLAAGKLDPRLFDVTGLIGFGYDQRRVDLPLIVTGTAAAARSRATGLAGASGARDVPNAGTAVKVAKGDLTAAWTDLSAALGGGRAATASGVTKLWLDGARRPALVDSVPQIGAPAAWSAGLTGSGVAVAVVDSGVDATQGDLAGQVKAAQDFTGSGDVRDTEGHGTHVASTIAGTGAAPGGYRGVAPGARLVSAKVCTDFCPESAILSGIQWSVDQGARIVNLSLGGSDGPDEDLLEAAVNRLSAERGVLFVVAAGNDGPYGHTVGSPASADAALAVGAVDKHDALAGFSARGPRVGDEGLKPDITAPGVSITAARSADSPLGAPGEPHTTLSGTSMAAPHVAGAAALLAQLHPQWTGAELKAALMGSAAPRADAPVPAQGAGRVDVARGIGQTVLADPPSLGFGRQEHPYGTPATRTLAYRNRGTAPVTLALAATGPFGLSATSLSIPVGGQAAVTVTANVAAVDHDGFSGGYVTATAGGIRVTTPVGFHREPEHVDLTLSWLDTAGQPVSVHSAVAVNLADGSSHQVPLLGQPTETLSLPKGRYTLYTYFYNPDGSESDLLEPELTMDRDRSVTFDARTTASLSVSVPEPGAVARAISGTVTVRTDAGPVTFFWTAFDGLLVRFGQPDPAKRSDRVTTMFTAQLFAPSEDPDATSPYAYHLAWRVKGALPNGSTRRFEVRDLATVDARFATTGGLEGRWSSWAVYPDNAFTYSALAPVAMSGRRTEYYATGRDLSWVNELLETLPGGWPMSFQFSPPTEYEAGKHYAEARNRAVVGPGFDLASSRPGAYRAGDALVFDSMPYGSAGWAGWRSTDQRTVITRDGKVLADVPSTLAVAIGQPPEEATYTVRVESGNTDGTWTLSTSVSCEWTFRSAETPVDRATALPLSVVRFSPPVDDTNTAPAGRPFLVPVEVQRQPGSAALPASTVSVDVSYDDGKTWRSAPVAQAGDQWRAALVHPVGAGFVSLRGRTVDTKGNTNTVTVLRAYRIG